MLLLQTYTNTISQNIPTQRWLVSGKRVIFVLHFTCCVPQSESCYSFLYFFSSTPSLWKTWGDYSDEKWQAVVDEPCSKVAKAITGDRLLAVFMLILHIFPYITFLPLCTFQRYTQAELWMCGSDKKQHSAQWKFLGRSQAHLNRTVSSFL